MPHSFTPAEISSYYRQRIPKLSQRGDEWRGSCPLHDGERDSFSVNAATGRWRCFSECDAGGDIIEFERRAAGVDFKTAAERIEETIHRPLPDRNGKPSGGMNIVAKYDYVDKYGNLVFQVLRLADPKSFRQRRPDPSVPGKWHWTLKEKGALPAVEKVPYRLNELIAADEVWLCEGEKDADRLRSEGFTATTTPGGAGGWRRAYKPWFARKSVVIVPDNDADGEKYAKAAAADLVDTAESVKILRLPELPVKGDVSDWLDSGKTIDEIRSLADAAQTVSDEQNDGQSKTEDNRNSSGKPTGSSREGLTKAQTVVLQGLDARFFRDPSGAQYARFPIRGHSEIWPIESERFRRWLGYEFFRGEGTPASPTTLSTAIETLQAQAEFEAGEERVFVRLGANSGKVYLDLCDDEWRVAEITPQGWEILEASPVNFVRRPGMQALPEPVRGGSIDDLRTFINAPDETSWVLAISWLVGCFNVDGPFPILVLEGEQGAAKTTTARILRQTIDPNSCSLRSLPRSEQDLAIAALNSWVLGYDNLSGINPMMADAMCRIATGGGFATRALYTNTSEVLINAKRPQIVNGIDQIATRNDFADRCLVLELPAIPKEKRREESVVFGEFQVAHAKILGALLEVISSALRRRPNLKLMELPRMADFAKFVCAAEGAIGWQEGTFLKVHTENRETVVSASLEGDAVAAACTKLLESEEAWRSTSTDLLEELRRFASRDAVRDSSWPKNGQALSARLNRSKAFLREHGILVNSGRDGSARWIELSKHDGNTDSSEDRRSRLQMPDGDREGLVAAGDGNDEDDDLFSSSNFQKNGSAIDVSKEERGSGRVTPVTPVTNAEESQPHETPRPCHNGLTEAREYEEFLV